MPPFKPMKLKAYEKWIGQFGWTIERGAIDYNLFDENGYRTGTAIKVIHPGP